MCSPLAPCSRSDRAKSSIRWACSSGVHCRYRQRPGLGQEALNHLLPLRRSRPGRGRSLTTAPRPSAAAAGSRLGLPSAGVNPLPRALSGAARAASWQWTAARAEPRMCAPAGRLVGSQPRQVPRPASAVAGQREAPSGRSSRAQRCLPVGSNAQLLPSCRARGDASDALSTLARERVGRRRQFRVVLCSACSAAVRGGIRPPGEPASRRR